MLASSFLDPVLGIDIHFEMVPTPAPVPLPIPNPFIGLVFDPLGLAAGIAIGAVIGAVVGAPFQGPVLYWTAFPATNTGTEAKHVPGHFIIPPGTVWAPFPKTPKPVIRPGETPTPGLPVKPENDAVVITGSKTVTVMGSNAVRLGDIALSCSEPLRLPSSVVLAVPKGAPILIGGPMSLDIMAAIMASLRTRFVSDSLHALLSRLKPSRFRNLLHRVVCFFTGHPVDVASGKVMTEFVDIELPGPLPLKVERIYSSAFASRPGPLGHGWSLSLDQAVWRERGKVVLLGEDGREIELDTFDFPKHRIEAGQKVYHPIERLTLHCEKGETWRVVDHEGVVREFAPVPGRSDGRAMIQKIRSRCGYHEIGFHYGMEGGMQGGTQPSAVGRLEWVRDSGGRFVHLRYDAQGRVTELHLPQPRGEGFYRHRRYEYDAAGDLVQVTDSLGHAWRFAYVTHLLTQETDRNGLSFYFQYDGLGEDAWCVRTWGDGGIYDHVLSYDKRKHVTFVTNSLGHTTQYHMNVVGQVVKIVDPLGGERTYEYDAVTLQRVAHTDELGNTFRLKHDSRGNTSKVIFPDDTTYSFRHDGYGHITSWTDANHGTWTWEHDASGLPTGRTDPLGRRSSQAWSRGVVTRIIGPRGRWATMSYDSHMNLDSTTYFDGHRVRWTHDRLGRMVHVTDNRGHRIALSYDTEGNPKELIESDSTQSFSYDAEGRLISIFDDDGVTTYEYRGRGNLTMRRRARHRTAVTYDTEGNVWEIINSVDAVHRLIRDPNGNITEEIHFDGSRIQYKRDKAGRVKEKIRPSGATIEYEHDQLGRVTRVSYGEDVSYRELTYDHHGRVVSIASNQARTEILRDRVGRVVQEATLDQWTKSYYDEDDVRVRLISSLGFTAGTERNDVGNASIYSFGQESERRIAWEHDPSGRRHRISHPNGIQVYREHDLGNRLVRQATVDARQGLPRDVMVLEWAEKRLATVHSSAGLILYSYDDLGNLVRATDESGYAEYRDVNPERMSDPPHQGREGYRSYDTAGRLLEVRRTHEDVIRYEYDGNGRLLRKYDRQGCWEFRWTGDDMLASVKRPDGQDVLFRYDALGRRTHKNHDGKITRWMWDGDKPLHQWTQQDDQTISGRLVTWLFEPQTHIPMGRLVSGEYQAIITDHQGFPLAMLDDHGDVIWTATADLLGRAHVAVGHLRDCPFRWPGQYEDEETGLHYNRFRYYDPDTGIYISPDPLGFLAGLAQYSYVGDPNLEHDPYGLSSLFRGDDFYRNGPIGMPLGSEADITTPWDHVRRESNQSSIFSSFAEDRKSASKFTEGNNIYKVDMERIRQLEAEGKIKVYTPDQVYDAMRNHADKKIRRDAANVRAIMQKNKEVLVEGVIPEEDVHKCK